MAKSETVGSTPSTPTNLQSTIDLLTNAKATLVKKMIGGDTKAGAKANSIDSEIASLNRINKRISDGYYA